MDENMLGVTLREVRGSLKDLNDKLSGENGREMLEKFNQFLRGEPVNVEEMIYKLLEWSPDLGDVPKSLLQQHIDLYQKRYCDGSGWRLPTEGEIRRALKIMKPDGFLVGRYYWTSVKAEAGTVIYYTYDGHGGLGSSVYSGSHREKIHLRLCREIKPHF